jgi:hypothetical protein
MRGRSAEQLLARRGLVILARDAKPADILASAKRYKNAIVLLEGRSGPAELPANPPNAYEAVMAKPHGATLTMPVEAAFQQARDQLQIAAVPSSRSADRPPSVRRRHGESADMCVHWPEVGS